MSDFLVAYSTLRSLRDNLPGTASIKGYYVEEFHNSLNGIKELVGEKNVQSFMVPDSEIKSHAIGNARTGVVRYGSEKWCDRAKLLVKIDAVLNYLAFNATPVEKSQIGFTLQSWSEAD